MKAIVLGTGPSLNYQKEDILRLKDEGFKLFGVNLTYYDFPLDCWIACDPAFHNFYGQTYGEFDKWHWDKDICKKYGYKYIEGRWGDGLSTDPSYIHYGHSSGYQSLNLAVHYGAEEIYLCGYDMNYDGLRHYFTDISDKPGEYPEQLRKWSTFDGLIKCYETIAAQKDLPPIYNCTLDSAMTCFPFKNIKEL